MTEQAPRKICIILNEFPVSEEPGLSDQIELLEQMRLDGWDPGMAFDDRSRVVKAWREAGIPCAQVAEGDF